VIRDNTELAAQSPIVVKIRAKNVNCTGPWSNENAGAAKIASCPVVMAAPFVTDAARDIRKDSITIGWTPLTGVDAGGVGVAIVNYEIQATQVDSQGATVQTDTTSVDGDVSSWTHEPLDNAETWKYEVRAENAVCGTASTAYSPSATFVSGEPPAKPTTPTVCIQDDVSCTLPPAANARLRGTSGASNIADNAPKVVIAWDNGSSDDNITEFSVKILNGDGEFVNHPDCDVAYAATLAEPKCALSMNSFWVGDFQMDQGTYITATISAKNEKGWSESSRWNTQGAVVEKVPSMMNPPEGVREENNSDVSLTWNGMVSPRDGGSAVTTYVLEHSATGTDGWTELVGASNVSTATAYTHSSAGTEKLHYRLAATNRWGTGPYSRPNLEIEVAQAPDQISSVTVNDAGMVRITWFDPQNGGGSVIEKYQVQVKNGNGDWVTPLDTCREGTNDIKDSTDAASGEPIHLCRIDMDKMVDEFSLAYDANIDARVRAVNAAGLSGNWQYSDDGAKVKTKPQQMPVAPERGSSTDQDTLHVTWETISSAQATGGSEIIYYSVYLNDDVNSIYQTSGTSFLYEKPSGSSETSQQFRVAATNIYGTGTKSDLSLAIEFGSVPAKISGLVSANVDTENTKATIIWANPNEDITQYNFEVLNKNTNQYEDANDIMGDPADAAIDFGVEFNCQNLVDDFGYQAGDTIVFRVNASNSVGDSEWSYPDSGSLGATSFSMLIL